MQSRAAARCQTPEFLYKRFAAGARDRVLPPRSTRAARFIFSSAAPRPNPVIVVEKQGRVLRSWGRVSQDSDTASARPAGNVWDYRRGQFHGLQITRRGKKCSEEVGDCLRRRRVSLEARQDNRFGRGPPLMSDGYAMGVSSNTR